MASGADQTDSLLACNICYNESPRSPVVTYCGHIYCSSCLHQWLQGQEKPCPVCRATVSSGTDIIHVLGADTGSHQDPILSSSSQLVPSQTEVLAEIEALLSANRRSIHECKAAGEVIRTQVNAINWEVAHTQRSLVRVPLQEQDSTQLQDWIDRSRDALDESETIRTRLDIACRMTVRLVRLRVFVRAHRESAGLWTSGIE